MTNQIRSHKGYKPVFEDYISCKLLDDSDISTQT